MTSYQDVHQPIVIDNGSGSIKAGFAGDVKPKVIFPNYVARPKYRRVMAGALEGDMFVGSKAQEFRGIMHINYPMEHGIVQNWTDMEKVWSHVYSTDQLTPFSNEHPVLLTEAPLNPRFNRQKTAEIFFENFNVPALYFEMQAVLALYAGGRTTGVVLDSGDGVTHVVPVFEGFAIENSIQRINVAGRDVTRKLQELLRKDGLDLHRSPEFELVREMKESKCYICPNPVKDDTSVDTERIDYRMPDNSVIKLGPARYRAPEILFRTELIGEEYPGIHLCLVNAIQKSDYDIRKTLYSNIVISGGTTLMQGFGDRLLNEVKRHGARDVKVRISAPQDRLYSTWSGGSILAGLDTFRNMWISKAKYEETGSSGAWGYMERQGF